MAVFGFVALVWVALILALQPALVEPLLRSATKAGNPFRIDNGTVSWTMTVPQTNHTSSLGKIPNEKSLNDILAQAWGKNFTVAFNLTQLKPKNRVRTYDAENKRFIDTTIETVNRTVIARSPQENLGNLTNNLQATMQMYERFFVPAANTPAGSNSTQAERRATTDMEPRSIRQCGFLDGIFNSMESDWVKLLYGFVTGNVLYWVWVMNYEHRDFPAAMQMCGLGSLGFVLTWSFLVFLGSALGLQSAEPETGSPFLLVLDLIEMILRGLSGLLEGYIRGLGVETGGALSDRWNRPRVDLSDAGLILRQAPLTDRVNGGVGPLHSESDSLNAANGSDSHASNS